MTEFEIKFFKQRRAIRNYAHAENISFELACDKWCKYGLAGRWAEQN